MCVIGGYNYKTSIPIRFADIDAFGHVNNAIYLTYFEIARSVYWKEVVQWNWDNCGVIIRKTEIEYLKPLTIKDNVYAYVRTSRVGRSSFDIEYVLVKKTSSGEEICTKGLTQCVAYNYEHHKTVPVPEFQRLKMLAFEALNAPSPVLQAS